MRINKYRVTVYNKYLNTYCISLFNDYIIAFNYMINWYINTGRESMIYIISEKG